MEDNTLCWCGSGKAYGDCHQMIDAKIELLRSQGKEVPDRCMIKTPEQSLAFARPARLILVFWMRWPSILRLV